jgi:hypothetical protein
VQTDEPPEKMRARAEKNGYKNGTKFGSLTSQIKYDPRAQEMLYPTPQAFDSAQMTETIGKNDKVELVGNTFRKVTPNGDFGLGLGRLASLGLLPTPIAWDGAKGGARPMDGNTTAYEHKYSASLKDRAAAGLLPTPTAIEGVKWTNTWNPNSQMGQSLSAMAGSGMLPTPIATDISHKRRIEELKEAGGQTMASRANGASRPNGLSDFIEFYGVDETQKSENAGKTSRLSPLFTEEMMGFPLMWTALPFLSESGAPKPSKPTATPSSPK